MDNQFLSIEPKKDTSVAYKRQVDRSLVSKAIYMVTDLFPEGEPLKFALRSVAVDILRSDDQSNIVKLTNLLTLSSEIGIVSTVNVKILLEGINNIKPLMVEDVKSVDLNQIFEVLKNDDLSQVEVSSCPQDERHVTTKEEEVKTTQPKVQQSKGVAAYTGVIRSSAASLREDIERMSQKAAIPTITTLDIGTRRKKILEVVKSKGQVTIHEFIQSIQGCSSKTIQRELTSLVLSGTLKKTGERRWSKYSLR